MFDLSVALQTAAVFRVRNGGGWLFFLGGGAFHYYVTFC